MLKNKIILGAIGAGLAFAAAASFTSAARAETVQIDPQAFEAAMDSYIQANPRLLERLNGNLNETLYAEQMELGKKLIKDNASDLFGWEDAVVIGNPDGAVTMVEFFDYNCHYCRSAAPTVAGLLAANDDLRIILMDLPILSKESVGAAEIGVALAQMGGDIERFHEEMWTLPGEANAEAALNVAEKLGADREELSARASTPEVREALQRRINLAQKMQISGTPSFVVGDQIVPGAASMETLQGMVDAAEAEPK